MIKTLVVVDGEKDLNFLGEGDVNIVSFESYLREYPKKNEPRTRIINLCDTGRYLSKGYYCSLLAEARKHSVLPSVKTINQIRKGKVIGEFVNLDKNLKRKNVSKGFKEIFSYFGSCEDKNYSKQVSEIFLRYPAPILRLLIDNEGKIRFLERYSFSSLDERQREVFKEKLSEFTSTVWKVETRKKKYRWDMAILVDHEDKVPPSDKDALSRFVKAANKFGINAEVLSLQQIPNITAFDALFIRETTAIDHHTYQLATLAEENDLVVIDDPQSILRCCNKVFLHDAFSYQGVPCLKTHVISDSSKKTINVLEEIFTYPMILKMPEGSFSKGVFKVENKKELIGKVEELFKDSSLLLVQEFCFTEYDWRIGVLNGRTIYACKYFMARNHWQIYNHGAKRFSEGGYETLPTFEVPKPVLEAALRATKIVGNGLYGVDIKERDGKAYVIEVNDNPSIEHGVEDAYLGDELYMQIMGEFQRRLEQRGR